MANKLRSKDFNKVGIYSNKTISIAMSVFKKHYKRQKIEKHLELIKQIKNNPAAFLEDEVLGIIASEFHQPIEGEEQPIALNETEVELSLIHI